MRKLAYILKKTVSLGHQIKQVGSGLIAFYKIPLKFINKGSSSPLELSSAVTLGFKDDGVFAYKYITL
jgi:hypothetical protein